MSGGVPNEFARVITVRQLNRDTSRIFEEVATKGLTLLVTRHGIPVATIHPAALAPLRPDPLPEIGHRPGTEDGGIELELDEAQAEVLLALRTATTADDVIAITGLAFQAVLRALGSLELKGLVSKRSTGYELSWRGLRTVESLERAQAQ